MIDIMRSLKNYDIENIYKIKAQIYRDCIKKSTTDMIFLHKLGEVDLSLILNL